MSVALSFGIRTSLYALSDIDGQSAISNKRLATGKKVSEAIDNPLNFFLSKGFDKNKADLANLLDSQNVALGTLNKTVKTIESISKLVEQVQALARQARQSSDDLAGGVRDTLGKQIATTLNQITDLTRDAGFNGKNLIGRTPDTLRIDFNNETGNNQTHLDAAGVDLRPNGALLGYGSVAAEGFGVTPGVAPIPDTITFSGAPLVFANTVAGNNGLDALITRSATAINSLTAVASTFAVNLSVLQIRIDYSKSQQRTLATASDAITLADVNEEGATLASLQTRQQIAVQALSLANRSDQAVLRLFG